MDFQSAAVNPGGLPTAPISSIYESDTKEKTDHNLQYGDATVSAADDLYEGGEGYPTEEEQSTLRRISAPMP
jgi:hypothetical protein